MAGHLAVLNFHTECHFFAVAAYKLIEYRKWVLGCGLCSTVHFSEINGFSEQDIKDLRDMREHVVNYFHGEGFAPSRWKVETPAYNADASSVNGTMIGGRLDWIKFRAAARAIACKITDGANLLSPPVNFENPRPVYGVASQQFSELHLSGTR